MTSSSVPDTSLYRRAYTMSALGQVVVTLSMSVAWRKPISYLLPGLRYIHTTLTKFK